MNQIACKAKSSEQYITLVEHPCTTNALLVLITKNFEGGEITRDQFMEVMTNTCSTLSSVCCNDEATESIFKKYDIFVVMNQLLISHFLSDNGLKMKDMVNNK